MAKSGQRHFFYEPSSEPSRRFDIKILTFTQDRILSRSYFSAGARDDEMSFEELDDAEREVKSLPIDSVTVAVKTEDGTEMFEQHVQCAAEESTEFSERFKLQKSSTRTGRSQELSFKSRSELKVFISTKSP